MGLYLFLSIYLIPIFKNLKLRFVVLVLGIIYYDKIIFMISYKFNPEHYHLAFHYQNAFLAPIFTFMEVPLILKLFGVGSMKSISDFGLSAADFGLGVYLLRIGLIMITIAIIFLLVPVLKIFLASFNKRLNLFYNYPWLWLGITNALLVLGHFISLAHYTVSLQAGGRVLFSFNITLLLYSLNRLYYLNQKNV